METESQKFGRYVKWLWLKRDVPRDFHVGVFMEANSKVDSSVPSPPLTLIESESLFRYLENQKLVFYKGDVFGGKVYSLNKVEHYKWEEIIKELKRPDWQRSWWFLTIKKSLVYIISIMVAAFLGVLIGHFTDILFKKSEVNPVGKPNPIISSNAPTRNTQNGK